MTSDSCAHRCSITCAAKLLAIDPMLFHAISDAPILAAEPVSGFAPRKMEQAMSKRLGGSPKEKTVSVQSEARQLLWDAVPQRLGDNRKSWIAHAAHVLGWTPRRVRAVWHQEARVISVQEMRDLERRYAARQQSAEERRKARNELQASLLDARASVPVRQHLGHGSDRQMVDRDGTSPSEEGRADHVD